MFYNKFKKSSKFNFYILGIVKVTKNTNSFKTITMELFGTALCYSPLCWSVLSLFNGQAIFRCHKEHLLPKQQPGCWLNLK